MTTGRRCASTPKKPVVSNSWPEMRVTPIPGHSAFARADLSTGGVPLYEDLPQLSAGWALKICSPLMKRHVSAITLIQCMVRTGSVCR